MTIKFANNVSTTLANSALVGQTTMEVASVAGFPTLILGDYFYGTLTNNLGAIEIVEVTSIAGNVLTCARGAEGTAPQDWTTGATFEIRVTAAGLTKVMDATEVVEEVQTATSGQTVFTLTTFMYASGENTLSVYLDGINQIVGLSYEETSPSVVTFADPMRLGALVKFTTLRTSGITTPAAVVIYEPAGTEAVPTTVQAKLRESVSVMDFGAVGDGVTDDSAAVKLMLAAYGFAYLPAGNWYLNTADIDTALLTGPGVIFADLSSGRSMYPAYRKSASFSEAPRVTFEDEFGTHLTSVDGDLNYTAFGSACMSSGYEIYAVRTGYDHFSNFSYTSSVVLYFYSKNQGATPTKITLYTTTKLEDVRDVNISPHPTRVSVVLIRFAEALSIGGYQTRLITYLTDTRTIESNRLIVGPSSTAFTWGNSLITPSGNLVFCTYRTGSVGIDVWRTPAALSASGTVTVVPVATIGTAETSCSEPNIGYWNDRIVMVYRRTRAAGQCLYTFDLEASAGSASWSAPKSVSTREVHAPALEAYAYNRAQFTFLASLGTARYIVLTASTTDFNAFYTTANTGIAGNAGASGGVGGYPSILVTNEHYVSATYAEKYTVSLPWRTRFERQEIIKAIVDIKKSTFGYVKIINHANEVIPGETGKTIGTTNLYTNKYTSNGANYSTEFYVKRALSVNAIYLPLSGTANASVEIYADGALVATTTTTAVTGTVGHPVKMALAVPLTLTPEKSYKLVFLGSAPIGIYDYRHNTRYSGAQVHFPDFYVYQSKNAASVPIGATSFFIPAFVLQI